MNRSRKCFFAVALAGFIVACLTDRSSAELIKGYPDALVCEVPKGKIVVYLSTVDRNGDAIYMKQDKSVAILKKDGTVLRNDKPVTGCTKHVFAK